MPDLSFEILSAAPASDMLMPALAFDLRVSNPFAEQSIEAVLLRCQIQIEVARRRYVAAEQSNLRDLFDHPSRWADTLRPMTWTIMSVNIPAFSGSTVFRLVVPCTFDLNIATSKYFHAIDGGEVPLTFLFSGSAFFRTGSGALQVAPISWNKEARFRLPVLTWKQMIDGQYPNEGFLHLRRDVLDELCRFKTAEGLATFDETIEHMLTIAARERTVT